MWVNCGLVLLALQPLGDVYDVQQFFLILGLCRAAQTAVRGLLTRYSWSEYLCGPSVHDARTRWRRNRGMPESGGKDAVVAGAAKTRRSAPRRGRRRLPRLLSLYSSPASLAASWPSRRVVFSRLIVRPLPRRRSRRCLSRRCAGQPFSNPGGRRRRRRAATRPAPRTPSAPARACRARRRRCLPRRVRDGPRNECRPVVLRRQPFLQAQAQPSDPRVQSVRVSNQCVRVSNQCRVLTQRRP